MISRKSVKCLSHALAKWGLMHLGNVFIPKCHWLVALGFNATLRVKVIIMAVSDAHVFPGFLKPVFTQLSFQGHGLICFRGKRRKNAGKNICFNRVSNSQPPGHESDTLTTEPPGHRTAIAIDP